MPQYERRADSVLPDFGEIEAAAAWGYDGDIEDMPPEVRVYEGIYFPGPRAVAHGSDPEIDVFNTFGRLGRSSVCCDEYYDSKKAQGML